MRPAAAGPAGQGGGGAPVAAAEPGWRDGSGGCGGAGAGEVLNCDVWTVATRAAVDLGADKIICLTLPEGQVDMGLPSWTPLTEARRLLNALAADRAGAPSPPRAFGRLTVLHHSLPWYGRLAGYLDSLQDIAAGNSPGYSCASAAGEEHRAI